MRAVFFSGLPSLSWKTVWSIFSQRFSRAKNRRRPLKMGQKKKLSKKEKARLEAEQAEQLRIETEKEKQRKLEEERERKRRERDKAEERQKLEVIENRIRRAQLKESVRYFEGIRREIERIKADAKRLREWEQFMRCNGLPSASNPGDLRRYVHMWCTSILENKLRERNWLLRTDERAILTQDKTVADLTRETLRQSQPNLGDLYAQRIQEVLGVLFEMEQSIDDAKLTVPIADDLKRLKNEIRQLLGDFIDDFTYRILSHVERDMESNSPGVAKHLYESAVFRSQVWTIEVEANTTGQKEKFKDNSRHTEIDFPLLQLQLMLPATVKVAASAIRGLWLNYDHFSDHSPSYTMPPIRAKHLDILQQTKKEWKKRKEILQATLDEATRDAPLTIFDALDEPETRAIDVDRIYTEYEDELNKSRRHAIGPDALRLGQFDVNLRSHRIVGGVYCIDYLEQPQQDKRLTRSSFIRTIAFPSQLTRKAFHEEYQPPPVPLPGVRRLPEEIEAEMKLVELSLDKLAMITLQLPDTVLWFEPPIVCRWEATTEATACNSAAPAAIPNRRKSSTRPSGATKRYKAVPDFDMFNIPNTVDICDLMVNFVVPRLPEGYCVRVEYHERDRDASVLRYIVRTPEKKRKPSTTRSAYSQPIGDRLMVTDSPRSLHPNVVFDKILHVAQFPALNSTDGGYLFSQLIEDLENLCQLQAPYQDQRAAEIAVNLGSRRSSCLENPSRRVSGVMIIREADISRTDLANSTLDEEGNDEESGSEFDDDDERSISDDDEKIQEPSAASYGRWSTRDVHDSKYNEDKLSIQFRTGRLGYFGFAANRYSNIPYQTWELRPDFKASETVSFSLTAAVVSLEVHITNGGYCMKAFQGGTTESLTDMIGTVYSLAELKAALTRAAVDIFPDEDAFCYAEGSCEKNYVMEMHLYNCMASLGLSHNFSWSRWNLLSGSRTAVLLMRELQDGKKVPNHSTLYITPMKAAVVDCTEVSASFSMAPIDGTEEFHADLYHLARQSSQAEKEKEASVDPMLRDNIAQILQAVRPLSFC